MGVTPGSWWVNKTTGQKLAVAKGNMLSCTMREGRRTQRHGLGRNVGRFPCYLEGLALYLAWLTEDELRGGWTTLRGLPRDEAPIPDWLRRPRHNDFLYTLPDPPYQPFNPLGVTVLRFLPRSGWICLSGSALEETTAIQYDSKGPLGERWSVPGQFDWGLQRYHTFFLPISEAVPRLVPRFDKIRTSIYEHINRGGALGNE